MSKWHWDPSIEKNVDDDRRYFGATFFGFGAVICFGKRSWTVRLAVLA